MAKRKKRGWQPPKKEAPRKPKKIAGKARDLLAEFCEKCSKPRDSKKAIMGEWANAETCKHDDCPMKKIKKRNELLFDGRQYMGMFGTPALLPKNLPQPKGGGITMPGALMQAIQRGAKKTNRGVVSKGLSTVVRNSNQDRKNKEAIKAKEAGQKVRAVAEELAYPRGTKVRVKGMDGVIRGFMSGLTSTKKAVFKEGQAALLLL